MGLSSPTSARFRYWECQGQKNNMMKLHWWSFHILKIFTCTGGALKCGVWIQNTYNLVNQKFSKLNDPTYCYCTSFRVLVIGSYYPHWCKHKFMNWCCHKLWRRCWICKTLNHLQACGPIELESWMTDVAGCHRISVRLSYILHKQKFKTTTFEEKYTLWCCSRMAC